MTADPRTFPTEITGALFGTEARAWTVYHPSFDVFGHSTEFIDADPEVAGTWDDRVWRDHP